MNSDNNSTDDGPHPASMFSKIGLGAMIVGVLVLLGGGLVATIAVSIHKSTIEIEEQVRSNRDIAALIGEVRIVKVDNVATSAKKSPDDYVYNITGEKGKGVLVFTKRITTTGHEQIENGTFYLDVEGSATKIDLNY